MTALFNQLAQTVDRLPFLSWFFRKGYAQGVFWANMISIVSVSNDVLMRTLGERLSVVEIVFFRFLFSMLTVLPFMLPKGLELFKTKQPGMHASRAVVGALAIALCCWSVNIMHLSENTTIMFAQPLFFLPLAYFLLKEKVDAARWIATIIGFLGLLIILKPGTDAFKIAAFVPMGAAVLFAILDIMAKKMISDEHSMTLLFYFGLGTTLFCLVPLFFVWQAPTFRELGLLFLLGIGANMIQICLFRAFSSTDASGLMPFRYVEFIVSAAFGYIFFSQIPELAVGLGAVIIACSAFYITMVETRKEKQSV